MPPTAHAPTPAARSRKLSTLVRCAGASIACVVLEFVLLTLLVSRLHAHYLVGAVVAGVAYLVGSFVINRAWVFRAHKTPALPQLLRHSVVTGGGLALPIPLLWLLVSCFHLPYQLGWLATSIVGFFAWTFPMHRRFTYRGQAAGAAR